MKYLYKNLKRLLFGSVFFFLLAGFIYTQNLPSGFSRVQVASGLSNPTTMAVAPDGRIFICLQGGSLRVVKNGLLLSAPFLSKSVASSGERGLIGVAVDPNFATNGYIYIYYTLPDASRNRISRVTANGDVMLAGSEVVILNLDPLSNATNHNGGAMAFGTDGKLYVAVGDNANSSNAQNLDTYHGKLLRINPDGSVPAGNPFTIGSEQRRRVWSYGLRNPFTFDIQPGTGRIFVNDVGENTWEEINDATQSGRNFGWPFREGYSTDYVSPLYAYSHGSGDNHGCSIAGGAFFNPSATNWPSQYTAKYFYLDYCNSWINYLTINGSSVTRSAFGTNLGGNLVGLEVGRDGNLYYLSRTAGSLYRIQYNAGNIPDITAHPQNVTVPARSSASFSVTATGTAPLNYQWQKNGVNIPGATSATYTIASVSTSDAGQYRVIVSNSAGSAVSNPGTLTVSGPPVAQIITPATGTTYQAGTTISFSGNGTDPEDGTLPASAFTWWVDFHHDAHTHPALLPVTGSKTGSFSIPNQGETSANVWYRIYLKVTDSNGASTTVYRDLIPQKSNITLATQPAGLQVTLDGQPRSTPVTVESVVGIQRTIGAFTQTVNGVTYEFDRWMHGGVASQTITTPVSNSTYTAVYRQGSTNLALNKIATASSIEKAVLDASKAVDGDLSTRWSSSFTNNQWLSVDLGNTYSVNRVFLRWQTAYGSSYRIETSTDNVSWSTRVIVTSGNGATDDLSFAAVNARYVRMYGITRGTPYGFSLWEFEVYGSSAVSTGIAAKTDNDNRAEIGSGSNLAPAFKVIAVPNPVRDGRTKLLISGISENAAINVIDLQGKLVFKAVAYPGQADLDLSELGKGVYIINVRSGSQTVFSKLIVE